MNEVCSRCGWCCRHVVLPVGGSPPPPDEVWAWRGMYYEDGFLVIPCACRYYMEFNGLGTCIIHENRPLFCRLATCPPQKRL